MSWRCEGLTFGYPGAERPAVNAVSLELPEGACTAVLGPNGSGKSTLFRLLLGTLAPASGTAEFGGRPVRAWERRAMARAVGVVGQGEESVFPLTARELVALGRFPHLGPWGREGPGDRAAIERSMERCDVLQFADRPLGTLSGGERQRVRLARALAQEPAALALDEPTTALDVQHEMEIFELLRGFVAEGGTVLLITHHLNLAARYADRLVLLDRGRLAAHGTPAEVLREERLEEVYRWPLRIVPFPGPGAGEGAPQVLPLSPGGAASHSRFHDPRPKP
jgi:iron complex transport system ATP-binding protein